MGEFRPYRKSLSLLRRGIYDQILKGLLCLRESIKIFDSDIDSLNGIIEYIKLDIPTLYYVGNFQYQICKSLNYSVLLPQYMYSEQQRQFLDSQINLATKQIVGSITEVKDWNKIVAVHDILCKRISYKEYGNEAHSIIGALLKSEAVCEGIAKAFKLICDEMQIESCIVKGQAKSSKGNYYENHSWNKVKIDNEWFNIDVTFDLTISSRNIIRHDYMFLTDDEMKGTHNQQIGGEFFCGTKQRDYFSVNNLIMANQQQLVDYIKDCVSRGKTYLEFKLPNAQDKSIVEKKVMTNVCKALQELNLSRHVTLGSNKELLVFTIEIL